MDIEAKRQGLRGTILDWISNVHYHCDFQYVADTMVADQIEKDADAFLSTLSSLGLMIADREAELPENPFDDEIGHTDLEEHYLVGKSNGFERCRGLMLVAGWHKTEPIVPK